MSTKYEILNEIFCFEKISGDFGCIFKEAFSE